MVTVKLNGSNISAEVGTVLSEAIGSHKPCGGHGRCGKCKAYVSGAVSEPSDTERKLLSPDELAQGVRLSCLTRVLGDCEVRTSLGEEQAERALYTAFTQKQATLAKEIAEQTLKSKEGGREALLGAALDFALRAEAMRLLAEELVGVAMKTDEALAENEKEKEKQDARAEKEKAEAQKAQEKAESHKDARAEKAEAKVKKAEAKVKKAKENAEKLNRARRASES